MRSTLTAQVLAAASSMAVTAAPAVAADTAAAQTVSPAAVSVPAPAQTSDRSAGAGARSSAEDRRAGKNVLNAGPEPRVLPVPGSRDHAAIFGAEDEDEQALAAQEQTLQAQRDQLLMLERLLNQAPAGTTSAPPAMIPLNTGSSMRPLAPTPAGSQLNGSSIDEMQRRVDSLRRGADTLRQGGR